MRSGLPAAVLRFVSLACRCLAWTLVALVVADALLPAGPRSLLLPLNGAVSTCVPAPLSGLFVFPTPFGGAFRGDFAILAVVLLVIDWLLARLSASVDRAA